LLKVDDLRTYFHTRDGIVRAVDGISYEVEKGETLAIVGESGSGKSVSCHSLLGLVPQPPGRIESGSAMFDGADLLQCTQKELRAIRGKRISMIFQDPMTSLNPYLKISKQLTEPLEIHENIKGKPALHRAIAALEEVGIPDAATRIHSYPHEFSGGMRQRAVIAIAISGRPRLLIADEPTTALDVTVQAEIVDLLRYLQDQHKMAILLITHDMGVVAEMAERVMVMYTGKIVEVASTRELFREPKHPYTKGLLQSIPRLGAGRKEPLRGIPGTVPDFLDLPSGCTFHPRCPIGDDSCISEFPSLRNISPERKCACYKVEAR